MVRCSVKEFTLAALVTLCNTFSRTKFSMICEKYVFFKKKCEPLRNLHSPLDLHGFSVFFVECWYYIYIYGSGYCVSWDSILGWWVRWGVVVEGGEIRGGVVRRKALHKGIRSNEQRPPVKIRKCPPVEIEHHVGHLTCGW